MRYFLSAGLLAGLAHRWPACGCFAWVAVALLSAGLRSSRGWRRALGLWAALTLTEAVAFSWLVRVSSDFLELSTLEALGLAGFSYAGCGTLRWFPLVLVWCAGERGAWVRPSWLLALGLASGDWLVGECGGYSLGDLLYTQWQSDVMRAALGRYGWWATSALMVIASVELAELQRRRSAPGLLSACGAGVLLFAAPPRDNGMQALAGVGAAQIGDVRAAGPCPPEVTLLAWPEGHLGQGIRVDEGEADYEIDALCPYDAPGTTHIAGMLTRSSEGRQNSAVVIDATATVRQVRAKRLLVPGSEVFRGSAEAEEFVPGRASPVLTVAGRRVGVLICFEVLSRSLTAEAAAAGAEFLMTLASDQPIQGEPVALQQWIGALSLRSAEYGLPAVRASSGGQAVIFDAGGRVRQIGPAASPDNVVIVAP